VRVSYYRLRMAGGEWQLGYAYYPSGSDCRRSAREGDHLWGGGRSRRIPGCGPPDRMGPARREGVTVAPGGRRRRSHSPAGGRGSGTAPATGNGGCDFPRRSSPNGPSRLDPRKGPNPPAAAGHPGCGSADPPRRGGNAGSRSASGTGTAARSGANPSQPRWKVGRPLTDPAKTRNLSSTDAGQCLTKRFCPRIGWRRPPPGARPISGGASECGLPVYWRRMSGTPKLGIVSSGNWRPRVEGAGDHDVHGIWITNQVQVACTQFRRNGRFNQE